MSKFQQAVLAAAVAAGALSAIGAGAGTAVADSHDNGPHVTNPYRPYQECSPQTVLENDIPVGVLGLGHTMDTTCNQHNNPSTH
ncbi:hypothetical protein [Streptomyces sp. NPDC048106]|uniref:hypothetical protein n=1 Tax=Streptomyces sp. NPDC048106 TaxID=3155750 RepID=UPI003451C52A